MTDQKRGERQPLPPGVQGDIVHIFGDFMTAEEMRNQMPSNLQIGSKTLQVSTKTINDVMRHKSERQRLERVVVTTALSKRRAARGFAANRVGHQTLQDAQTALNDACDALVAYLEAQGEEK